MLISLLKVRVVIATVLSIPWMNQGHFFVVKLFQDDVLEQSNSGLRISRSAFNAATFPIAKISRTPDPSMVINLSSFGHILGSLDLDDLNYERRPFSQEMQVNGGILYGNIL